MSFFKNVNILTTEFSWQKKSTMIHEMKSLDRFLEKENRKALLLLNNYAANKISTEHLKNVKIEFFMPNVTSMIQPCDLNLNGCT